MGDNRKHQLTQKQKLFVIEYLVDFNASQAAVRAGYKFKTARVIGYENLTKPYIKEKIDLAISELIDDKNKIIVENINFWVKVRDSNYEDTAQRIRASEQLGKYAGMFTEKREITGKLETSNTNITKYIEPLTEEEAKEAFFRIRNKAMSE